MVPVRTPSRGEHSSHAEHANNGSSANSVHLAVGGASALSAVIDDPNLSACLNAKRLQFNAGDQIISAGSPATHVYLIHRGQVRLYQPGQNDSIRLIDVLGREQWFGIAAIAKAEKYDCQAIAVTPVVVSEIPVEKLLPALMAKPEAMAEVMRDVAQSVVAARAETSRLMFDDCTHRLIDALLRLSHSAAATQREDGVVLHMTHHQLAQTVGAARETISLALTQFRRRNLIRTGRNQLFFNPAALRKVLENKDVENAIAER
ncbi:MAG: Crp/Fnr family transcriptional regulator [Phycisphaerae bacterium]|nr:Crp/Fnr family transcriptional regulator [Phycisphaerae bacterium]